MITSSLALVLRFSRRLDGVTRGCAHQILGQWDGSTWHDRQRSSVRPEPLYSRNECFPKARRAFSILSEGEGNPYSPEAVLKVHCRGNRLVIVLPAPDCRAECLRRDFGHNFQFFIRRGVNVKARGLSLLREQAEETVFVSRGVQSDFVCGDRFQRFWLINYTAGRADEGQDENYSQHLGRIAGWQASGQCLLSTCCRHSCGPYRSLTGHAR